MPLALFGRLTEKMFSIIDQTEEVVDTYDLMERWTLDAIGNAGFGRPEMTNRTVLYIANLL